MIKQASFACNFWVSIPLIPLQTPKTKRTFTPIGAALDSATTQELTAKERRQLRQQRRESKAGYNWREEVEEKLIKKPKKVKLSAGEARNLDNLADLGPQWYAVRVSRTRPDETADLIARLLVRHFPHVQFKVYAPSVKIKTKLKKGGYSVKSKPMFPGCIFLWCVLNKELHDFIREECAGVGGFIGSKVGNNKRQINRPRPVAAEDMEEIFWQTKEEQQKYDRDFEEELQKDSAIGSTKFDDDVAQPVADSESTSVSQTSSDTPANDSPRKKKSKLPTAGSIVRVVSGTFAEYVGTLKKLNRKTGKVELYQIRMPAALNA